MRVDLMSCTPDPLAVISLAAGTCYGKSDINIKRVRNCLKAGHLSVFEHASTTFRVSGISRACSHQLVRHRLASFSQQSQRYCRIGTESRDWYVMPPSFTERPYEEDPILGMPRDDFFELCMLDAAKNYRDALDAGIRPEDARYLLPEATKTEIVVTMNCRELFHFLDVRDSNRAQWEIRDLARAMVEELLKVDGWRELMEMRGDGE